MPQRRAATRSTFGGLMQSARESQSLTLAQVAAKAKLSQSFLSRVENGLLVPRNPKVRLLATALGQDPVEWEHRARIARVTRAAHEELTTTTPSDLIRASRDILLNESPEMPSMGGLEAVLAATSGEIMRGVALGHLDLHLTCGTSPDGTRRLALNSGGRRVRFAIDAGDAQRKHRPGKLRTRRK